MNIQDKTNDWLRISFFFCLSLCLCISGCLSSSPQEGALNIIIIKKEVTPSELGECLYSAEMLVTNNGTIRISPLRIFVEVHDPETGKSAASTSVDIKNLEPAESKNISVALSTHCRTNYTLRAYATY